MAKQKLFTQLTPAGQARLKKQGVHPASYNAWQKKTPEQKAKLAAKGVTRDAFVKQQTPGQQARKGKRYAKMPPEKRRRSWNPNAGKAFWDAYKEGK
jgi:hypothetical protein